MENLKEKLQDQISEGFLKLAEFRGFQIIADSNGQFSAILEINGFQYRCTYGLGKFWFNKNSFEGTGANFWVRHHKTEQLWEDFKPFVTNRKNFPSNEPTFSVQSTNEPQEFEFNETGVKDYLEYLDQSIDSSFEYAQGLASIDILDKDVNHKVALNEDLSKYIINYDSILFRRTVLAKLNRNPLFSEICEYHKSFFPKYIEASSQYPFIGNIPEFYTELCERLEKLNLT